jgi:hypothetical protein
VRRCKALHPEFKCFLCSLISERTKPLIAANKYLLLPETEFFNRIGRTKKYSNYHHSDYACLLNICSAPELGHTPAAPHRVVFCIWCALQGPPPDDVVRFLGARHAPHQGIPIYRPQCHNAMISMGSDGPGRTRIWRRHIDLPDRIPESCRSGLDRPVRVHQAVFRLLKKTSPNICALF